MTRYTTIRISLEDKKRLKRLAMLMGEKSLVGTLRRVIEIAEREFEKQEGNLEPVLESLKHAKDIGETSAEDVDRYLYGEG